MDHEPKQTVQRLRFAGKKRDGPLEHSDGKTPVRRQRAQRLRASQAKPGALRREQDAPPEMSRLTPDPLHAVTGRLRHQVSQTNEDENAGVDAALSGEQAAETLLQAGESAYRRVKAPGRTKPVPQRTEKAVPHGLQPGQAVQSDTSSLAHARQKRAIRRAYARLGHGYDASGPAPASAAKAVRKAGAARRPAALVRLQKRRLFLLAALGAMLLFVMNGLSACAPLGETLIQSLVIGTYPATEEDVLAAERAYAQMERELQEEIDHYAARHPGYDEYIINAQEIWHDPYALMAIISARHGGEEWTLDSAYGTLEKYFQLQYILTEEVQTETRYRTEIRLGLREETDPGTGETLYIPYEYEEEVPYTYRICTVTLENKNLSHLPVYSMSREAMGLYALYMSTLGNMPDLFAGNPHASHLRDPMIYEVPQEVLDADPRFAALLQEANRYIGYPYVWGGDSPETSFDCSGFISYVFTNSGVYDTGRRGATGLYSLCRKISPAEARPGDLVFFQGTLGEGVDGNDGITHVGMYVGDHKMIHCGNPIGYADLNDAYWRQHFYGYGRVPE